MKVKIENCELRGYNFRDRKDGNGQYLIFRFEDSDGIQHSATCKDNGLVQKFDKGLNCTVVANLYIGTDYTTLSVVDFE